MHPRERLKKKPKRLTHPKDRMKNKELEISLDHVSALMKGKFSFRPEKLLNKRLLFDTSRVDEETI